MAPISAGAEFAVTTPFRWKQWSRGDGKVPVLGGFAFDYKPPLSPVPSSGDRGGEEIWEIEHLFRQMVEVRERE